MKNLTRAALAATCLLCSAPMANAAIVTLNVSGTFDSIFDLPPGSNSLEGLVGTDYSMSLSFGTDNSRLIRTEFDASQFPVQEAGWFFNTNSSLTTVRGSYAVASGGVVASVQNDFIYDGSQGIVPAGTYDILQLTGWRRGTGPVVNPTACPNPTGGSLLGDAPPGPCSLAGSNTAIDLTLFAGSAFVASLDQMPFGSLNWGEVVYGTTSVRTYLDGVEIGAVAQDPPLSFVNGVLTGPGMSVGIAVAADAVPEPTSLALLGFSLVGFAAARRRRLMGGEANGSQLFALVPRC